MQSCPKRMTCCCFLLRRKNVILSPHVYPPSITFAQSATSGNALYARLNRSFGFYTRTVRARMRMEV